MGRLVAILATVVMAGLLWAQDDPKKAAEKEAEAKAKKRIEDFKASLKKCKTNDDYCNALKGLGDDQHPLVLAELKIWLAKPTPEMRLAAADEVGKFKNDEKAAETLINAAKMDKVADVSVKCLEQVAKVSYRKVAKELVFFFAAKDIPVAREAIDTSGSLKSKDSIEPLIKFVEEEENEKEKIKQAQQQQQQQGGGQQGGGSYGGKLPSGTPVPNSQQNDLAERQKRVDELLPRAVQAFKDISGEKGINTSKEMKKWWQKSKPFFKDDEDPKKEEKK